MPSGGLSISSTLGGRTLGREQILSWEGRRITAAAKRLRVDVPASGSVATRREALLQSKLALGSENIIDRLSRDIRISEPLARAQAAISSRRRVSVTRLAVTGGTAQEFVAWFREQTAQSNEPAMLRACPDHFVIRTGKDGRQEVLETTGGSPLAARFSVDYTNAEGLVTPAHPKYPLQIAGVALGGKDQPIGGVRHQFCDTETGFEAILTVEFPFPTLPTMVSQHRWHLACEFSNWIEDALR